MIDFEHRKVAISLRRDEPIGRTVEWLLTASAIDWPSLTSLADV